MSEDNLVMYLSFVLSVITTVTAIVQTVRIYRIKRNALISLWLETDRIGEMYEQLEAVILNGDFVQSGVIGPHSGKLLHEIYIRLKDEYSRIAAQIAEKGGKISDKKYREWVKQGKLKRKWQKEVFKKLVGE